MFLFLVYAVMLFAAAASIVSSIPIIGHQFSFMIQD